RSQPELFLSTYSTAIKAGHTELDPPKVERDHRYNYEMMLCPWAEVFGEENLIVRIYDRKTLIGGDVIKDFLSILNYEPGPDFKLPDNLNLRLDGDTLQFLREINKYVPPFL